MVLAISVGLATIGVCVFGAVASVAALFYCFSIFTTMGTFCPLTFDIIIYEGEDEMQRNFKKTIIIHILKVLYNFTSFEYPATQTAIVNYLNDIGISCTRKTVGRNLKYLIDSGLPIKRKQCKNGGYYYDLDNDNFFVRTKINDKKENN